MRVDPDHILDLGDGVVGIGRRQVYLVQHRHHLDAEVERGVAVGNGLRLDTLRRINHQQRALARRQRAADLIGEVHVPGCVDQVQVVALPVKRHIFQRSGLGLDGDATLAFQVHRIEDLSLHLAV